jgi:hypothetical protein
MGTAARTYLEFVWTVCFGFAAVLGAPLVTIAALALGAYKGAVDRSRARASWPRG